MNLIKHEFHSLVIKGQNNLKWSICIFTFTGPTFEFELPNYIMLRFLILAFNTIRILLSVLNLMYIIYNLSAPLG